MIVNIEKQKSPAPPSARFSIMIPSWNNLEYLQLCIRSILTNSHHTHQIIVHINEGADGTLEWVKNQPYISYSYSKENIGVCYALNSCRTLASTDYLVYLNDDMYVCPDWDLPLMEAIEKLSHNYFFFSSTAIEINNRNPCTIQKDYGHTPAQFDEAALLANFRDLPMYDWQGATWPPNIVHKQVWDLVGGYSIEYSPGMYSDPDFSFKLWKLGVRLFMGLEKSRVYHFGSVSVNRVRKNNGYYTFIGKWGITSSTFSKYFLRRGEVFDGPLIEQPIPISTNLKNLFKRLWTAIRK